jgi:protein SCO1
MLSSSRGRHPGALARAAWFAGIACALSVGPGFVEQGRAAQRSVTEPRVSSAAAAPVAAPFTAAVAAPVTAPTRPDARALQLAQPRPLPPFTLTDQQGRPFRSAEGFRGRVTLVFFGFVHCPDVCPTTLLRLRNLLAAEPALADVQVVMISVDGERDSPASLKRLLDDIEPRFIGLTGDPARVRPLARSFTASFIKQPPSGPDGDYVVDHSAQLYLLDRAGRLSTIFFNASDEVLKSALRAAAAAG